MAPTPSRRRLVGQPLLYAVSVFASLGVFLFGYDQGVMSGIITQPHFIKFFNRPTSLQVGSMVAVLEVGAFVTSLAAGRIGDIIGRKGTLFCGAVIFTIGGAIQTFTSGFGVMLVGRIISGFGVGLLSTIVPIYQSEISPPNHRGALACAEFTGNIFGYAFSVWTDYFCSFIDSDMSWRIPLFIQSVIGAILAIGSLLMPESPRWLIDNDKDDEGLRVIADLHGGDLDNVVAKAEYREIKDKVIMERESGEGRSYGMLWRRYKSRVMLAMSSQAFAQLNGINVISYYAPKVFEEAGWRGRDAILMTGINSIIYVLSTLPPWYLVDRWGRRPILLSGAAVCCVSLLATGWWMYVDVDATPKAVVACVIVFNAAFGYSWGPIPWLYPPEIMPLTVRAKGVSISTATNWIFNFLVGEITPWLQEVITYKLYYMHAFFCFCSFILVYFVYPETKGVPLEEMDAVFGEDKNLPHGPGFIGLPVSASENSAFLQGSSVSTSYPPKPPPLKVSSRSNSQTGTGWLPKLFQRNKPGSSKKEEYRALVGADEDTVFDVGRDSDDELDGDDEADAADGYEMLERGRHRDATTRRTS